MRYLAAVLTAFIVLMGFGAVYAADKGPDKLVFKAKTGDVSYDHAKHLAREKGDCKGCHDKLFKQSATAPLNYKGGVMHKTAETAKTSCAACHHPGGTAFAAKGNCNKCHTKKG